MTRADPPNGLAPVPSDAELVLDSLAGIDTPSLYQVQRTLEDVPPDAIVAATSRLSDIDVADRYRDVVDLGYRIVTALRIRGSHTHARRVLQTLVPITTTEPSRTALRVALAHLDLLQHHGRAGWRADIPALVGQSNEALAAGRPEEAADLMTLVVDLVFDTEHHADPIATPLIDDTDIFLAPLRDSAVLRLVQAPRAPGSTPAAQRGEARAGVPQREAPDHARVPGTSRPHRVVVVLNRYQHFADNLVTSLDAHPQVDLRVVQRDEIEANGGCLTWSQIIVEQVRQRAIGEPPPVSDHNREWMDWADTVFVDWADEAAQWVSMVLPASTRLVVRLHSIEALGPRVHLIEWSRVDDLVFVGDHVRDFLLRAVPAVATGPRLHVLPNAMDLQRFDTAKSPAADRTLAIVGWAQRVKDPVWTLEVLARLRVDDPSWRLVLVGADFSSGANKSNRYYRYLYEETIERLGLADAVQELGYRSDLEEVFADVGFIVSSSRRESFGVALCEGAASGAIPVVRHWTMYHLSEGPRALFPDDWVVDDVQAAAARIRAMADPRIRSVMGARARRFVLDRYDWANVEQDYLDVILDLRA